MRSPVSLSQHREASRTIEIEPLAVRLPSIIHIRHWFTRPSQPWPSVESFHSNSLTRKRSLYKTAIAIEKVHIAKVRGRDQRSGLSACRQMLDLYG